MPTGLEDLLAKRPVDKEVVQAHVERMRLQVEMYRLAELRKATGITQQELADRIGVSQRQISKLERGNIESAKLSTLQRYVTALGGRLEVTCYLNNRQMQLV